MHRTTSRTTGPTSTRASRRRLGRVREKTLARQKELGVVPQDTELTERPDFFPAWDTLTDSEKKLYARQMEVFAGYSENADWNIGRLIDEVEKMGDLDNTLVIYIWGDNGASMEGTVTGSFNELTFLNGLVLDPDQQMALIEQYGGIEELGGIHTAPHFAVVGARLQHPVQVRQADRQPPRRYPRPDGRVVAGEHRSRLRRAGAVHPRHRRRPDDPASGGHPEPDFVDGIAQEPMDGTSFLYSFNDKEAPEQHTRQFFEMFGSRGMYEDGWWAASRPERLPWDVSPATLSAFGPDSDWDPDRDIGWELYDLTTDFSQAHDIAADHPDKVLELQELWWSEAERNRVLPLMGGLSVIYGILPPMPTQTGSRSPATCRTSSAA